MSQPSAPYRILAILLLVAVSACAPRAARWTPAAGTESATLLEVRNDQWDDLAVYLERGGALLKLGTVPGLSTRVLKVPAEYLRRGGSVRLKAMRPGSGVLAASVPFNLVQGQRAEWVAARTSGPTGVAVR
jgi:hypothetical protein